MTMMKSEQLKHGQQEKIGKNFHKNFDLNVTAQELEEEPDLQCELIENHYSQYRQKHVDNHSMETDKHEGQVPQAKTFEGSVDHLLILAQSAEILAAQSEDTVPNTHANNQNQDQVCSQELLDGLSSVSQLSSERCGLCYEVTGTRLTQIRKQARCKYLISGQIMTEDNQCKHLQRKTVRLSKIKQQARCKSKNDSSSSQMIAGPRNEQWQAKISRLSQMKHQARSKNNTTVKEGTEEYKCINQHSNRYRVTNDSENQECQHAAKRLRSFKTKKPRQQLRTERVRNSAGKKLQDGAVVPADKDLITCQQELPQTSGCFENLDANFRVNKLQGHHGSDESSGHRYKSHQHIPYRIPVQNNVLLFTGLPNYIFQQYDPNLGWMPSYMNHVQLKEYHRVVSRHHRAERIKEQRALKCKQQKSKNHIQEANSEAQKENLPVKRLRLTQLRREVRIRNQCSVMQRPGEN